MMQYVLETDALTKQYKNFSALDGLTMHIPKGSINELLQLVGLLDTGNKKLRTFRLACGRDWESLLHLQGTRIFWCWMSL